MYRTIKSGYFPLPAPTSWVAARRGYARHRLVPKGLAAFGTWENIDVGCPAQAADEFFADVKVTLCCIFRDFSVQTSDRNLKISLRSRRTEAYADPQLIEDPTLKVGATQQWIFTSI